VTSTREQDEAAGVAQDRAEVESAQWAQHAETSMRVLGGSDTDTSDSTRPSHGPVMDWPAGDAR
jgi:hypothetical protein